MATFLHIFCLLSVLWLFTSFTDSKHVPKHYVVYMGSSTHSSHETAQVSKLAHLQLLSSIIPSNESDRLSLIHHYHHAIKGFSAMLTEEEVSVLSDHDDVVSIFSDPILQFQTTRSWDFLNVQSAKRRLQNSEPVSSNVIIGVIDSGIWPESPSFNDTGFGEIPSKWKGLCMEAPDFNKSNCNRKLIGARYYLEASPRDADGHGTHTASTAAGVQVANASYYGLAHGTAKGGLPSARIAVYKVCSILLCSGAALLKAMDDAISDGVDVISISLSGSLPDILHDPIAIGALHAEQHGVIVTCAGGNKGPNTSTIANESPWIFTIAASNIDRDFRSTVVLGNGKEFQGTAITFSNQTRSETYTLAFGETVAATSEYASQARECIPGTLDPRKVAGKIVVCENPHEISDKVSNLVDAKAKGLISIMDKAYITPTDFGTFPVAEVGEDIKQQISKYINSTQYPKAAILPTIEFPNYRPAPEVASFSSRGPGKRTQNILKPDIMAPGVAIIAATVPDNKLGSVPPGKEPSKFRILSGTSMACPHVAGAAALIKSVHPRWTSSMVKSALMTTATSTNNDGKPLTNSSGNCANPHEAGVGEISPSKALHPGLVFETTIEDYILFLCSFHYPEKTISALVNRNVSCPSTSSDSLISNINYPSISISQLPNNGTARIIKRTVTNVGLPNARYTVKVDAPKGLVVKVCPEELLFNQTYIKASFNVSFTAKDAARGYNFGSITWFDGKHTVRSVFAVNV